MLVIIKKQKKDIENNKSKEKEFEQLLYRFKINELEKSHLKITENEIEQHINKLINMNISDNTKKYKTHIFYIATTDENYKIGKFRNCTVS